MARPDINMNVSVGMECGVLCRNMDQIKCCRTCVNQHEKGFCTKSYVECRADGGIKLWESVVGDMTELMEPQDSMAADTGNKEDHIARLVWEEARKVVDEVGEITKGAMGYMVRCRTIDDDLSHPVIEATHMPTGATAGATITVGDHDDFTAAVDFGPRLTAHFHTGEDCRAPGQAARIIIDAACERIGAVVDGTAPPEFIDPAYNARGQHVDVAIYDDVIGHEMTGFESDAETNAAPLGIDEYEDGTPFSDLPELIQELTLHSDREIRIHQDTRNSLVKFVERHTEPDDPLRIIVGNNAVIDNSVPPDEVQLAAVSERRLYVMCGDDLQFIPFVEKA